VNILKQFHTLVHFKQLLNIFILMIKPVRHILKLMHHLYTMGGEMRGLNRSVKNGY